MSEPCIYMSNWHGECSLFDEDCADLNPEGADAEGYCSADGDEDPSWCQSYEGDRSEWEEEEEEDAE